MVNWLNLNKLRKLGWQDILLVGIIFMYLFLQNDVISQYKSLPSPLYGGDYYFQLGSINHVRYGGDFYKAPNVLDSEPIYFILYSTLVAVFANLLGMSSIQAMFGFSQFIIVLSLSVFYVFAYYLFRDKTLALVGAVMYLPIAIFPILKYTEFTYALMMPLFFFSMFYFFKKRNFKSTVIAGITYGLCGISHGSAFPLVNIFLFIVFAYMAFVGYIHPTKRLIGGDIKIKFNVDIDKFKKNFLSTAKLFSVIFLIGFSISLIYWYKPIFIYHGKTLNDMQNWAFPDFSNPEYMMIFLKSTLEGSFFNFSNQLSILKSILTLLGILFLSAIFARKIKKMDIATAYIFLILLTGLIATFHYFITIPLVGTHLSPPRIAGFTFPVISVLLIVFSLNILYNTLKIQNYGVYISIVLLIIVLFLQNSFFLQNLENNRWIDAGKNPISPDFLEMQKWVLESTDVNDVFLSTNELSFALNALTGRKLVISRRSHNSAFLDIDQREADAAIILYGDDSEKKLELLKDYDVDYLYWNYYWIQSDYSVDESGRIMSWFDPIIVKDTPESKEYISRYGISYYPQRTWIDPAMRGEYFKKLDLLFIVPPYRSFSQPWVEDLDDYLEPVWEYKQNDQIIARIYKVRYQ